MSFSEDELRMKEELLLLITRLKSDKRLFSLDEANTKQMVILPILSKLGWDTHDIDKVELEHPVIGGKVDILLKHDNKPEVFIEAKRVSANLEEHQFQLLQYAFAEGVELAVLTNGVEWCFYHPLSKGNWENRKFDSIDISKQNTKEVVNRFIEHLSISSVGSSEGEEVTSSSDSVEENTQPGITFEKEKIMSSPPTQSAQTQHNALLRVIVSLFIIMLLLTGGLYLFFATKSVESAQILPIPQYPQMPTSPLPVQSISAFMTVPFNVNGVIRQGGTPNYITVFVSPNSLTQPTTQYGIQLNNRVTGTFRAQINAVWSPADIQANKKLSLVIPATQDEINNHPIIEAYWDGVNLSFQSSDFTVDYTFSLATINNLTEQQLIDQQNQQLTQQYQQQLANYQQQYTSVSLQRQSVKAQQDALNTQYSQDLTNKISHKNDILYIFIPIDILLLVVILLIIFSGKITGKEDAVFIKNKVQGPLNDKYDDIVECVSYKLQEPDENIEKAYNTALSLKNNIKVRENELNDLVEKLYNTLKNETEFEKWMWSKTQEGLNARQPGNINQIFKRMNIDEMSNEMGNFFKQYPVYASEPRFAQQQKTIIATRKEITETAEKYSEAVKVYNSALAAFPINIQEAQDKIDNYEKYLKRASEELKETKYFNSIFFKLSSAQNKESIMIDTHNHDMEQQKNKLNIFKGKYGNYKSKVFTDMGYET